MSQERIAVIGLGYVGLPVALAFAKEFPGALGFDIDRGRIEELTRGEDRTDSATSEELAAAGLEFTAEPAALEAATFFVVAVPTPIDANRQPDLRALLSASEIVGAALRAGDMVVYESTVHPGVTEEICAPVLERASGLRAGEDFQLGYSPERINPGDSERGFTDITKVVAGLGEAALRRVADVYGRVVRAGIHEAPSIKVAEAAKVIENTQRDLNIALMNELSMIFGRLGIRTADVLAACRTKWNFLPFVPGLVGGHCIGVDPYYLTAKAESVGFHPQVILAGRRINDGMGAYVAQRVVKLLIAGEVSVRRARVGILGLAFKPNVRDARNSRVPDIVQELRSFGVAPLVHDPLVPAEAAHREYGLDLASWDQIEDLDALVLAVPHRFYLEELGDDPGKKLKPQGVLFDVKSVFSPEQVRAGQRYWSL